MFLHVSSWAPHVCRQLLAAIRGQQTAPVPITLAAGLLLALLTGAASADDPFAAAVRPTEPLTPEEEEKSFHLPPGFRMRLFAAEPEIQKPMNLAFDGRGRLWVSGSTEYPYAAPADRPAKDSIRILEDTDKDGRVDKVTVFADGLNIPIGLYPYRDGVIAFTIPNIVHLRDTDGDGRADKEEVLYGPFGVDRDTHGMNNAFRRGLDGWIYACHGWANVSSVAGRDGRRIEMQGGNTYRFRPDGSAIEHFTWGQVNPFGMTLDQFGDLFTADCHTRPIMLLLRGGYYDSFGKPHNGLGYVPPVMEHTHGSTAIAGTTYCTGMHFPAEFRGNMFTGNVMTSRVNRDSIRHVGSTVQATQEPDFVVSDDPWFRPVDLQFGPEGALYIADFYNKIIGHVEVPLNHPGRDRHRARIWRITYVGTPDSPGRFDPAPDLTRASAKELAAALGHPNLSVRQRAADQLVDRIGQEGQDEVRGQFQSESAEARAHTLWTLYRLECLTSTELAAALEDPDRLVRAHAYRVLAESPANEAARRAAVAGLADSDGLVRRKAADAVGRQPHVANIDPLLGLLRSTPPEDFHLIHQVKLALLATIRPAGILTEWRQGEPAQADRETLAGIALALPNEEAGVYLLDHLRTRPAGGGPFGEYLKHAAKHLPTVADVERLVEIIQAQSIADLDQQLSLLESLRSGLAQRGLEEPENLRRWSAGLAEQLLDSALAEAPSWLPLAEADSSPANRGAWKLEKRRRADGGEGEWFLSTLPFGERYTGILRSRVFTVPTSLSFFLCGHQGPPEEPARDGNLVRLRLVGSDGGEDRIVALALAPRNDVAQRIDWDLAEHAGKPGYLEVVDGLALPSYAWLAVAGFEPAVVAPTRLDPDVIARRVAAAADIARRMQLTAHRERLGTLLRNECLDAGARSACAKAMDSFSPEPAASALAELLAEPALAPKVREMIAAHWTDAEPGSDPSDPDPSTLLAAVIRALPQRMQAKLALILAGSREGAELLLAQVAAGAASPRLLQDETLRAKLLAAKPANLEWRLDELTDSLPPLAAETQHLLDSRRANYAKANPLPSAERGREQFIKHCSACHQVGGKGAVVGPQLDGIGTRGLDRVMEDVLDPNRNVDPAFFTTTYALSDGRVMSGLFRRAEGPNTILVDGTGKELAFPTELVEEERRSRTSLMPANVASTLAETELFDLVAFLLAANRAATPEGHGK